MLDFSRKDYSKEELLRIMASDDPEILQALFSQARKIRKEVQGNKIFAYGFVYFTTYCRNNCNFCYYRNSNKIERYRKNKDEVLAISKSLIDSGVNLIDLTMGEDPQYHAEDFETVCQIIKEIKDVYDTPVMISPGVVNHNIIDKFAEAGADFYALYQETHNRELYAKMRVGQDYDARMNAKLYAKEKGIYIEEGLLAGIGETSEDIVDSLLTMGEIGARQVRVMSFIPQEGSPMEDCKTPDRIEELKIIALMRLLYPSALIPASLDVDGIRGLKDRINAGANLITSIIPPKSGFMGVAHSTMDVDEGGRTVEEAASILDEMGLRIASKEEYEAFLRQVRP
ncbi:methylornithine synthase PylB [Anaerotruncus sp. 80]|uniref:Methylornithine synthase PylB n=1 Tax=Anaerotruncus colihominis TaxID=169435 RepID=A0A845QF07_9FIRM|nr:MULTISPECIES: methylornithine synthase PylB [Anaerotruncus]NBH60302.1 methylornithine synthase PylB [Anaerotruncus colihominis]NCF00956.1 methylornithine synthase PylB [Anaerotruncus sp. 80]